jgi:hypothetical protein
LVILHSNIDSDKDKKPSNGKVKAPKCVFRLFFFILSSYLAYILILTRPNEAGRPDNGSNVQPSSIKVTQQTIEQYEVLKKIASLKKAAASEKALASL